MGRQSRGQVFSRYGRKFDQLGVNTTTVSILQGKRRRTERRDCMDGDAGGGGGVTVIGDVIVDFVKEIVKPLKKF